MAERELSLTCDCGLEVSGPTLDDVIAGARLHARREHGMDLPALMLTDLVMRGSEPERSHAPATPLPQPRR
jgi:hypothetical protein